MTIEEIIQKVDSVRDSYHQAGKDGTLNDDNDLYPQDYWMIRDYVYNKPFTGEAQFVFDLIDTAIIYGFMKGRDSV